VGDVVVFIRPGEVLDRIITLESAGKRCRACHAPIVRGVFRFTDAVAQFHPEVTLSFPSWRHADGSPGHGAPDFRDDGPVLPDESTGD
jgi:hypothetical protein